ncbi:MAG: hypothetical protein V1733_02740 [bacterium]
MNEPITGGNEFRVPEGYFDNLPARIRERIAELDQPEQQIKSPGRRFLPIETAWIAFCIVALVSIALFLAISRNQSTFSGIEKTEIPAIDLADYLNLDESTVIEVVASEVPGNLLSFNGNGQGMVELNGELFTKDEIIEYLIEKDNPISATYELTVSNIINPNK